MVKKKASGPARSASGAKSNRPAPRPIKSKAKVTPKPGVTARRVGSGVTARPVVGRGKKPASKSGAQVSPRKRPKPPAARGAPAHSEQHAASRQAAITAIEAAMEKMALLPVLLDVSGQASYTDFIAVVSGRSDRQVDAIAENIRTVMRDRGHPLIGREGTGNGRWALLDFGDVVVHVFYHPVREFYDIESLWIDAPRVPVAVPPEAKLVQSDALYDAP